MWYFWSSAIDPLSACILFGDIVSLLSQPLSRCCIVVTDDSESLDESDNGSCGVCCCVWFWVNLILDTLIFGDGVNVVLPDDDVGRQSVVFDEKLLTLLLQFAFKFIRLSFCTLFSTTRIDEYCCLYGKYVFPWPFSSSSSSLMFWSSDGKWLCDERDDVDADADADDIFNDDDCCCCCCCCWRLDKLPDAAWFILLPVEGATCIPADDAVVVVVVKFCELLVEEQELDVVAIGLDVQQ